MDIINEKGSKRLGKLNIALLIGAVVLASLLVFYMLFSILPKENTALAKESEKQALAVVDKPVNESQTDPASENSYIETELDEKLDAAGKAILGVYNATSQSELSKEQSLKYNMAMAVVEEIYLENGLGDIGDVKASEYLSGYFEKNITLLEQKQLMIDVPYISQEGILPNGCEAVSATMLLRHYGYNITAEDFADGYLYCLPYKIQDGVAYAPDPDFAYAGDPSSEDWGYGCYPPVIVNSINKYLTEDYHAENITGVSMVELRRDYLEKGIPVAVWVTINFEDINKYIPWYTEDTNEKILYPANLHCMVLCGYDGENYIFNDPYNSNGTVKYPVETVNEIFNIMGRRAVAVIKDKK